MNSLQHQGRMPEDAWVCLVSGFVGVKGCW